VSVGGCRPLRSADGAEEDDPSAKVRPEQGLLGLRATLGVFANLRPVKPYPCLAHTSPLRAERIAGVDLVVVRELTGGIYFGEKRRETVNDEAQAIDVCRYSTSEIERIVRVAGDLARTRRGKVTSIDKANVLETSRLWRSVTSRVMANEYPDVQLEHMLVDSCAMRLIQTPADFDVIVTENMFGDILTDEAAVLSGSIGLLPSASLGASTPGKRPAGLYEPIHGSAPSIAGKQMANPVGSILSAALLFRHSLEWETEARAIESAVQRAIIEGVVTVDLASPGVPASTTDAVARYVAELVASADSPVAGVASV